MSGQSPTTPVAGRSGPARRACAAHSVGVPASCISCHLPNNPTGKVFTRAELSTVARRCARHNVMAITDEIHQHIILADQPHVSIAARTVTIRDLSRTFRAVPTIA